MEQTLKFLGRGSAFNVSEGNTSAYIKDGDCILLIDCGSNIFERILKKDLLNGCKNIYVAITHLHPDHVGSLGDLIFYCYYKLGIKVKLLYTANELSEYLLLCGITNDKYEWFYGEVDAIGIKIKSEYACHCGIYKDAYGDISNEYHEYDNPKYLFHCHSFIVTYCDKQLFYSGDCYFVDWNDSKISSCNEFYIDCSMADYHGNVHYNINKLYDDLYGEYGNGDIPTNRIFCMHFDCNDAIKEASKLGFGIVEID